METKVLRAGLALRVAVATALLAALTLAPARAADQIGIVLSSSPSGAVTDEVTMRIAPEATSGTVAVYLRQTTHSTLFGVELSATPLVDSKGVSATTPTFDLTHRTLPTGGELRRSNISISGLKALGTFHSTLVATHAGETQTLGTLTVVHARRAGDLQIDAIAPARGEQTFPSAGARLSLLVTVRNAGDAGATFGVPSIASLTLDGGRTQAELPALRVTARDGRLARAPFVVAAGDAATFTVVLDGVSKSGRYAGVLRISAAGHEPVDRAFGLVVRQGPLFPAVLIALGVALAFVIRRRYSSGRVGRSGQRRLVERLAADLSGIRENTARLEAREARIVETLERRLVDVEDALNVTRAGDHAAALSHVDRSIDLLADLVAARSRVRSISPRSLQATFDEQLGEVANFLTEGDASDERFRECAQIVSEIPDRAEDLVRERIQSDVERFLGAIERSDAVAAALPLDSLRRISAGNGHGADGFEEAAAGFRSIQLSLARLLAEDLLARLPDADDGPPGFSKGWPKFRASTVDALKTIRKQRRGEQAADAYRRVWQDYTLELAARLKSSAIGERRRSAGARKEQLARVIEACDRTATLALELDAAAVDSYRAAVEGFVSQPGRKPLSARARGAVEDASLPPPITVVAAGIAGDRYERSPLSIGPNAGSLTAFMRRRHAGTALVAAVAAIPAGLALLWSPNETWGTLTDGAAIFGWGFGLQAVAGLIDAKVLGARLGRATSRAPARDEAITPSAAAQTRLVPAPSNSES
jgi:hypothetical protein